MRDTNLVFVVAGASSGIAREVIPLLADQGRVVGLVRSTPPENRSGISFLTVDYFSDDWSKLRSEVGAAEKICFINFIATKSDALFLNHSLDDFRAAFDINVLTNVAPLKALVPKMIAKRWGRILLVSSTRGARGDVGTACYSCAKSALNGLSGSLAREYARFGITSNILSLGYFPTPMFTALTDEQKKALIQSIPSRALGSPTDVASAIQMVVSGAFINARTIYVDGGAD